MANRQKPKGTYYPSGFFVNLDWSIDVDTPDYLPYLCAFGHEQVHFLQHVGSSFGVFLADIEDFWVSEVINCVSFGLEISGPPKPAIKHWIEAETNIVVKRCLEQALELHEICSELKRIALFGGSISSLLRFTKLYRRILDYQARHSNPSWRINPNLFPVDSDIDFPFEGVFGAHQIMECAASFVELHYGEDRSSELYQGLPVSVQEGLNSRQGKEIRNLRIDQLLETEYFEPFLAISGYLPENPQKALAILPILLDLALMTPIGRYSSLLSFPPTIADLHPGIRLLRAAEAVSRLGIEADDVIDDYSSVVNSICTDVQLRWPQPEWIAIRTSALSRSYEDLDIHNRAVAHFQLKAAQIRREKPGVFAFPRAPLIDDLRIPIVHYTDGVKTSLSQNMQVALIARYQRKLYAQAWIEGSKPEVPEVYPLKETLAPIFDSIFTKVLKE